MDMIAILLLAVHLAVADGKLYGNGIGWSFIDAANVNFAVGGLLQVEWSEANRPHHIVLRLLDEDGQPVRDPGGGPVEVSGDVEVGRPPGHPEGVPFTVPLPALQIAGLPLSPASRFVWQLTINGETREYWEVGFSTRPELRAA
jgi:hypothetical protein